MLDSTFIISSAAGTSDPLMDGCTRLDDTRDDFDSAGNVVPFPHNRSAHSPEPANFYQRYLYQQPRRLDFEYPVGQDFIAIDRPNVKRSLKFTDGTYAFVCRACGHSWGSNDLGPLSCPACGSM